MPAKITRDAILSCYEVLLALPLSSDFFLATVLWLIEFYGCVYHSAYLLLVTKLSNLMHTRVTYVRSCACPHHNYIIASCIHIKCQVKYPKVLHASSIGFFPCLLCKMSDSRGIVSLFDFDPLHTFKKL